MHRITLQIRDLIVKSLELIRPFCTRFRVLARRGSRQNVFSVRFCRVILILRAKLLQLLSKAALACMLTSAPFHPFSLTLACGAVYAVSVAKGNRLCLTCGPDGLLFVLLALLP